MHTARAPDTPRRAVQPNKAREAWCWVALMSAPGRQAVGVRAPGGQAVALALGAIASASCVTRLARVRRGVSQHAQDYRAGRKRGNARVAQPASHRTPTQPLAR